MLLPGAMFAWAVWSIPAWGVLGLWSFQPPLCSKQRQEFLLTEQQNNFSQAEENKAYVCSWGDSFMRLFCFLSLLVTSGPPNSSLQVWQVSAEDSGKGFWAQVVSQCSCCCISHLQLPLLPVCQMRTGGPLPCPEWPLLCGTGWRRAQDKGLHQVLVVWT